MTDATITDLTEYRLSKKAEAFSEWSDSRVKARVGLLQVIAKSGLSAFGDTGPKSMFALAFPNGFDPLNHPEDNLKAVTVEGVRRGVLSEST